LRTANFDIHLNMKTKDLLFNLGDKFTEMAEMLEQAAEYLADSPNKCERDLFEKIHAYLESEK